MRKAIIVVATAGLFGSSAGYAIPKGWPPPVACPQSGGATKAPFYAVTATQNVMPGPRPQNRAIRVSGHYRIQRGQRLRLVVAKPQGIISSTLLLRLRTGASPNVLGRTCQIFLGNFPPPRMILRVQIVDPRGRTITVPVQRAH